MQMLILDRVLFSPAPDYLLKVKGDSMRDEGIFDGDLIGVHRTGDARSGQIVVARIDEEITVKLLKVGKDRIRRSEEHTSELQSIMRNSYAVFCFKNKPQN